jgi:hypothetical protein
MQTLIFIIETNIDKNNNKKEGENPGEKQSFHYIHRRPDGKLEMLLMGVMGGCYSCGSQVN